MDPKHPLRQPLFPLFPHFFPPGPHSRGASPRPATGSGSGIPQVPRDPGPIPRRASDPIDLAVRPPPASCPLRAGRLGVARRTRHGTRLDADRSGRWHHRSRHRPPPPGRSGRVGPRPPTGLDRRRTECPWRSRRHLRSGHGDRSQVLPDVQGTRGQWRDRCLQRLPPGTRPGSHLPEAWRSRCVRDDHAERPHRRRPHDARWSRRHLRFGHHGGDRRLSDGAGPLRHRHDRHHDRYRAGHRPGERDVGSDDESRDDRTVDDRAGSGHDRAGARDHGGRTW